MEEKARYSFLKAFAKVYYDEMRDVFKQDDWDNDVNGCKTKVMARTKFTRIELDGENDVLNDLTSIERIEREEKVRQEIRDQARDNEALLEMARQIDDLRSEMQELKRARVELCSPSRSRVEPDSPLAREAERVELCPPSTMRVGHEGSSRTKSK